mmetsp:Transcript_21246/g.56220  ORF Transcript_21246/g.56220 Transcript_21246/m.56220 type:complete len:296 (+) Transcript_21246:117-1004(+)
MAQSARAGHNTSMSSMSSCVGAVGLGGRFIRRLLSTSSSSMRPGRCESSSMPEASLLLFQGVETRESTGARDLGAGRSSIPSAISPNDSTTSSAATCGEEVLTRTLGFQGFQNLCPRLSLSPPPPRFTSSIERSQPPPGPGIGEVGSRSRCGAGLAAPGLPNETSERSLRSCGGAGTLSSMSVAVESPVIGLLCSGAACAAGAPARRGVEGALLLALSAAATGPPAGSSSAAAGLTGCSNSDESMNILPQPSAFFGCIAFWATPPWPSSWGCDRFVARSLCRFNASCRCCIIFSF